MKTPFQELVSSRRSVRRYLDRPVEREKILACLEAARLAPSAQNSQPWRFLVIDDPELKRRFSQEVFSGLYSMSKFAARAPALILICARPDFKAGLIGKQLQGVPFHFIDIGIAGEHIVLQAQELGLGTCWIGWFNIRRTRKFFGLPRGLRPVCLLALGYFEPRPPRDKVRKKIEDIVSFNKFGV